MNMSRSLPLIAAIIFGGFAACNYSPDCWYYGEGTENAGVGPGAGPGGGVIIPTGPAGANGFGDEPRRDSQDATDLPPAECNSIKDTPCHRKCLASYNTESTNCGHIDSEAQRKSCHANTHTVYTSCLEACERAEDCLEDCKRECDRTWEKCRDNCPRGDKNCLNECTQAYGKCLKDCDTKCK